MAPTLVPVRSSNLRSVGYDSSSQSLYIEFHTGRLYEYSGVSAAVYAGLMSATSHGAFFAMRVRPFYRYRRLR